MKKNTFLCTAAALAMGIMSFSNPEKVNTCYANFNKVNLFKKTQQVTQVNSASKVKQLKTEEGVLEVSPITAFQLQYLNKKKGPVVTMEVEYSAPASYQQDQEKVLKHLQYLNTSATNQKRDKLSELHYNGYTLYGTSDKDLKFGETSGTFVLFPGNDAIIYLTFHNMTAEGNPFATLEEYKASRNSFLGEYTIYLKNCHR